MSDEAAPRLDLAPQRRRPLALWNPWDSLVLLYWVFLFPQAIRWYVETNVDPQYRDINRRRGLVEAVIRDKALRQLVSQGLFSTLVTVLGITRLLIEVGFSINMTAVIIGVVFGIALGASVGVVSSSDAGCVILFVSFGIVFGIGFGSFIGAFAGATSPSPASIAIGFAVVSGLSFGAATNASHGVSGGIATGVAREIFGSATFGAIVSIGFGWWIGVVVNKDFGVVVGIISGIAIGVGCVGIITRTLDWVLVLAFRRRQHVWHRMVWLPLPSVRRRLIDGLMRDWETGVHNLNQHLAYSLQFISVVSAANSGLAASTKENVLARVAMLTDRPFDWELIRFCSADFGYAIRRRMMAGIPMAPQKREDSMKTRHPDVLRLGTPAQCACAGFWLWHEEDAAQAAEAFKRIRELSQGEELYRIAETLAAGETTDSLEAVSSMARNLGWLDMLPDPKLRPATLKVLQKLRAIAQEVATAQQARSDLNRASALGCAIGKVRDLILHGQENGCPDPEWPLVKKVAERWQDILTGAAVEAGEALPSLVTVNTFVFYSSFISYSHADKRFAHRLHDQLQARGIRCWLDEHDLKPGDRILDVVDDAIRIHDKILLCCSKASLNSWWVKDEIRKAQERERRDGRDIIIPLNIDGYLLHGWQDGLAADLRSRLAADFTGWENDNAKFEEQFERVVRALRTDEGAREKAPESKL